MIQPTSKAYNGLIQIKIFSAYTKKIMTIKTYDAVNHKGLLLELSPFIKHSMCSIYPNTVHPMLQVKLVCE